MATMAAKRKRDTTEMDPMRAVPMPMQEGHFTEHDYGLYLEDNVNEDLASVLAAQPSAMPEHHNPQHAMHAPATPQTSNRQRRVQAPGSADVSATDTASAALAQYHNMIVPEPTARTFMNQSNEQGDRNASASGDGHQRTTSFGDAGDAGSGDNEGSPNGANATPGGKPSVGSDEWHKVRRDNHKEVERRRRETINEGINELAKIVPGCEKNKGSILARAVQFITQLKDNETQNIEKWTLEKLLTEQAIAELSSSCDKLKAECQRAWNECAKWKAAAQKGGIVEEDAKGVDGEESEEGDDE